MTKRYNPPPNWPVPPEAWTPPPGWQPDPAWGPAPDGWQVWTDDKPKGSWFGRHKVLTTLGALVVLFVAIGAMSGGGDNAPDAARSVAETSSSPSDPTAPETTAQGSQEDASAAAEQPAAEEEPAMTASQENAVQAAENYLDFAPFSKKGLIQQLSSQAGDGYPKADAVFAVNHIDVNWNEQAVKAAKNYLDLTPFSRDGLVQQLSSSAGDDYTHAQAVYAVNKVGL
ncbi:MAG: Ltp family lipoprotein [Actinomycetes bacterium]